MHVNVEALHEFRFESTSNVTIIVNSGTCEHLGSELLHHKPYSFTAPKTFIFAHTPAVLKITPCDYYISADSSVPEIAQYFDAFQHSTAPCIVVGQGRSTFTTILKNYLVRASKTVLVTELAPESGFFFPGCLTTGIFKDTPELPLVYFYGCLDVNNKTYYNNILNNLASAIKQKEFNHHIIITNYQQLEFVTKLEAFKGEVVVLKDEKTCSKILNSKFIAKGRYEPIQKNFDRYFNGANNELVTFVMNLNSRVVRIGEEFVAPESALPIGEERKIKSDDIIDVKARVGSVLGVSHAKDEKDVGSTPIKGFVKVESVGENSLKVRAPQANLKCMFLLHGDI